MGNLSDFVEGIVSHLGRSFLLAGFIPMLVFVAINQYVFFAMPARAPEGSAGVIMTAWNLFPAVTTPWLGLFSGENLTTIVLALALSFVVVPLNAFVIKFFEGLLPGMKAVLFPFYMVQLGRYRRLYAGIADKRTTHQELSAEAEESGKHDKAQEEALVVALDDLHSSKEQKEPAQSLPYDRRRLAPTRFGNAWAVMEEYPYARYGIDSMVFWPYVRTIMANHDEKLLAAIDGQKLLIDTVITFALALGVLTVEALVLAVLRLDPALLVLAVVLALLFWAFYQAGVSYTRSMGMMVGQAFDLYRYQVLDAFGVARPADLDAEYWVWNRLAAFIRRGEPFYFDMLERSGDK